MRGHFLIDLNSITYVEPRKQSGGTFADVHLKSKEIIKAYTTFSEWNKNKGE